MNFYCIRNELELFASEKLRRSMIILITVPGSIWLRVWLKSSLEHTSKHFPNKNCHIHIQLITYLD